MLSAILNIKNQCQYILRVKKKKKILIAAVKGFVEKRREAVFEENITVSQTLEEERGIG